MASWSQPKHIVFTYVDMGASISVCVRARDKQRMKKNVTNSLRIHVFLIICVFLFLCFFFLSFDLLLFRWNLLLQSHFSCLLCLTADIRFFISFHSSSFFSFLSNSILNLLPIDCDTTIKSKKIYRAYHLLSLPLYRFFSF